MFKNLLLMTVALMLWVSPSFAQDENSEKKRATGESQAQESALEDARSPASLLKKYQDDMQARLLELPKRATTIQEEFAEDENAREKIQEAILGLREEWGKSNELTIAKILEIAVMVKDDEDVALEATIFAMGRSKVEATKEKGAELIVKHHLNNENLADLIMQANGGVPTRVTFNLYQRIIDESESETVRGMTTLALAAFVEQLKQIAPLIKLDPQIAETFPQLVEFVNSMEDEFDDEAIISRYEKLIVDYGDVESGKFTIKELVGRKLKAIKTRALVSVGKVAPEIEGPDIDGQSFKLSDYRGKIVMLDFWGDW